MSRVKNLGADEDANTATCAGCGSECYHDDTLELFAKGEKTIELCENCYEEAGSELDLKFESDELTQDDYARLDCWAKINHVLAFIPASEQINDIEDVREFFAALTDLLIWHPDNTFDEYRYQDTGERIFDDSEAEALNLCMERCFDVCERVAKDKPDVYALGIESLQKAGKAPPTPAVSVPAPRLVIEVEGGVVTGAYSDRPDLPFEIWLVDLDGAKVGEATKAVRLNVERIGKASDIVFEALMAALPDLAGNGQP